jgi:hypothetical protein
MFDNDYLTSTNFIGPALEDVKKSRQRKGREDPQRRIFRKDALRALRSLRST